ADADVVGRAADEIGDEPRAFRELDHGEHVGQLLAKSRRMVLLGDGERVDRPAAARPYPFRRRGQAGWADGTGIEARRATIAAALEVELVPGERLPVTARLLVDARQGLPVGPRVRHLTPVRGSS